MAYQEVTKNDYAEQLIENARTGKLYSKHYLQCQRV